MMRIFAVFAVLFSLGAASANAMVIHYDSGLYTGTLIYNVSSGGLPPENYTTDMRLTGTVTLATPLVANMANELVTVSDFSFFDGINTYTPVVATFNWFRFTTDADAEIIGFYMYASFPAGSFQEASYFSAFLDDGLSGVGVADILCGPNSGDGCSYAELPSYYQEAWNDGTSQVLRVEGLVDGPVGIPVPGGLLIVILGLAGLVRQRARIMR